MSPTPQPQATMEQRLTLEVELDMLADELQSRRPRDAAVWRAMLLAAERRKGTDWASGRSGDLLANHLLDVMAVELARVGDIRKCYLPVEVADFCRFMALEWPATLGHRAGGSHG